MNRRQIVAIIVASAMALSALACSPYDKAAASSPPPSTQPATPKPKPPAAQFCDQACIYRFAHAIETARIHQVFAFAAAVERARIHRIYAYAAAVERARVARQQAGSYRSGQCGGSLPPCYVMMRESRGNIHAQNPRSTASGKWQFLDSTWGRHRGYAKARHAPEWVQDERARHLWNGGRGCSHWSACG